eukprot:TCONS_00068112-protein
MKVLVFVAIVSCLAGAKGYVDQYDRRFMRRLAAFDDDVEHIPEYDYQRSPRKTFESDDNGNYAYDILDDQDEGENEERANERSVYRRGGYRIVNDDTRQQRRYSSIPDQVKDYLMRRRYEDVRTDRRPYYQYSDVESEDGLTSDYYDGIPFEKRNKANYESLFNMRDIERNAAIEDNKPKTEVMVKRAKVDDGGENGPFSCGFETDCTKYFQFVGTKLQWKKSTRIPDRKSSHGASMEVDVKKTNTRKDRASMSYKFNVRHAAQCNEFYYNMFDEEGCDVVRLLVTMQCDGENKPTELFRKSWNEKGGWNRVLMNIKKTPGTICTITWRASQSLSPEGRLNLDDITMYNRACPKPNEVEIPSAASCTLEGNTCEWKETGLKWSYSNKTTPTLYTGPDLYYGKKVGPKYAFLEASGSNFPSVKGVLTSRKLKGDTDNCFRMMAYMYGEDLGTLQVSFKSPNVTDKVVYERKGDQGKRWFEAFVTIPANTETQIEIKGVTGTGPRSDIAIDDILVEPGNCDEQGELVGCSYDVAGSNDLCHFTGNPNCGEVEINIPNLGEAKQNRLVQIIPYQAKDFEISFDVQPGDKSSGYASLVHLTTGSDCCGRGSRHPAIYFHPNTLRVMVCTTEAVGGHRCIIMPRDIPTGQTSHVQYTFKENPSTPGRGVCELFVNGQKIGALNVYTAEFPNVKIFSGDIQKQPVNNKHIITNFFYKNTAKVESCTKTCTANVIKTKVNKKEVTVAKYNKTQCPVSFENEIEIPLSIRNGRLACMAFDYLIGQNKKGNAECEIKVQYREFVSNRWVAKPVHTFKDKFEFNVWMPFRRDFDVILEENKKYRIGVIHKLTDQCPEISFANMKLLDGPCALPETHQEH